MAVRETNTGRHDLVKLPFSGYHSREITEPDALLTETGPGTPMGEYFRRSWLPICLSEHLTDLPKAVRTLGEDLVTFRDKSGRIGVLHRHCSHRGTSLEYGIVSECGIRCCYHGWLFDVDGTILETPGEPPDSKLKDGLFHGAYPAFELHGMVWAYMGPPELVPDKPHLDVFEVPAVKFVPFALPYNSNWLNTQENSMDPFHAVFLHGTDQQHFENPSIGLAPNIKWRITGDGDGMLNMAMRRLDDEWIWARINHSVMPLQSFVPTNIELPKPTYFHPAIYMRQHIPVDDRRSILFGWRAYGTDRTKGPDHTQNGWNLTDIDGQTERPSYEAAQRKAGDFEAQGSIWYGVARPDIEHRGTTDAGVVMMRRLLREILEGDVPTAWPKPAGSNGDKPKAQNILAQDSVINVNRRADADEDWDLLTKAGEEITEVVIEGSDRFDDDERVDWIVARIKEIEAKYRG